MIMLIPVPVFQELAGLLGFLLYQRQRPCTDACFRITRFGFPFLGQTHLVGVSGIKRSTGLPALETAPAAVIPFPFAKKEAKRRRLLK
tara:strand:+ start:744 stop:1007 length:264 start_codon:yes stop_codon:yes gene_type:complete